MIVAELVALQMLIFIAARFLRSFGGKPAELERQIRLSGSGAAVTEQVENHLKSPYKSVLSDAKKCSLTLIRLCRK